MSIFVSISLTIGYIAVCCFFSALVIGLWYGAYKHITEGLSNFNRKGKSKLIKVASMVTMVSFVVMISAMNVFFWSRSGKVFEELQCSCGHK